MRLMPWKSFPMTVSMLKTYFGRYHNLQTRKVIQCIFPIVRTLEPRRSKYIDEGPACDDLNHELI